MDLQIQTIDKPTWKDTKFYCNKFFHAFMTFSLLLFDFNALMNLQVALELARWQNKEVMSGLLHGTSLMQTFMEVKL